MKCHTCGNEIVLEHKAGRQELCPKCSAPLHACLNCRFYSPGAYHDCKETEAEWVSDKASPNFCDYFEPDAAASDPKKKIEEVRKKLDELFKK